MAFNAWQFGLTCEPGDPRSETERYVAKLLSGGILSEAPGKRPLKSPPTARATGGTPCIDPRVFHGEGPNREERDTRHQPRALRPWEHKICDRVKQFRRDCSLSQLQLARVLNTSLRSVKRWEAHKGKPTERRRKFLGFLVKYVAENGLPAFIGRYVREEPRYQKSGPASSLAENSLDSRVARESPSAFVMGLTTQDPLRD
jgi:DNA-binding transcriptional regulator YiaG